MMHFRKFVHYHKYRIEIFVFEKFRYEIQKNILSKFIFWFDRLQFVVIFVFRCFKTFANVTILYIMFYVCSHFRSFEIFLNYLQNSSFFRIFDNRLIMNFFDDVEFFVFKHKHFFKCFEYIEFDCHFIIWIVIIVCFFLSHLSHSWFRNYSFLFWFVYSICLKLTKSAFDVFVDCFFWNKFIVWFSNQKICFFVNLFCLIRNHKIEID